MSFEKYTQIFEDYQEGEVLRAHAEPMKVAFSLNPDKKHRYRLFVTGETTQFYLWKNEPDEPSVYQLVSNALDPAHAQVSRYCLDLSSKKPEKYIRRLYKKVMWPPLLSYLEMHPVPDRWKWGIHVATEDLKIEPDGYVRMELCVYYRHEGVDTHCTQAVPDEVHTVDFKPGTNLWSKIENDILLPEKKIANVGMWIEGVGYSGKIWLERPFLTAESGENLLPDFDLPVTDKPKYDWTVQNLSRKEWPEFEVKLNGKTVFEGEIFERCHRDSEWEIDLPESLLKNENQIEIRLISDYHDPVPYAVREIGIVEQPGGKLAMIACPEFASLQNGARILVRTEIENAVVRVETDGKLLENGQTVCLKESGLHGICISCRAVGSHAKFKLVMDDTVVEGEIANIIDRPEDQVITGTGDLIYVEQRLDYVEEYLSWYVSNGVGNLLTIRPTYRWSGTRVICPEVWKLVTRVLGELGIRYVHMLDGRELPGMDCNPTRKMLAGEGFLGRQNHERDGAAFYWNVVPQYGSGESFSVSPMAEQYCDMVDRLRREHPEEMGLSGGTVGYYTNGVYISRDPDMPRDYKATMERTIASIAAERNESPRHTGPSNMFKYMFRAGYEWLGAETMYGSMEVTMAFLRGACAEWKKDKMGVHHAVQWSSSPQDALEHFRRYRLALYVSYMQGATDINTEEGLWHLEEYYSHFHRFSAGCAGHIRQQQDFHRYVASHSRRGKFVTPMALIQGRCDGWHGFGNRQVWGWNKTQNTEAENSWELMKVFYPLSKPGEALYIHGCDNDHPVGYQTGTPMGNVDAIPAEAMRDLFEKYRVLAFMGYHLAETKDGEILAYVENGGKVILTRAHLIQTTKYEDVLAGRLTEVPNHPFGMCASPEYRTEHLNGGEIRVCVNVDTPAEVLLSTDEGTPLVGRYSVGKGKVILVNALAFPANPVIRPIYEKLLGETMRDLVAKEKIWAETGDDVGSAVYELDDGSRDVYFLPVDWYRPEGKIRRARLLVGGHGYEISMPFGTMIRAHANGNAAAWPHTESGDVLSIEGDSVRIQGSGKVCFTLAKDGVQRDVTVDFDLSTQQMISF